MAVTDTSPHPSNICWVATTRGLHVRPVWKFKQSQLLSKQGLRLLEKVVDERRRRFRQTQGTAVRALLAASPVAYWRLDEFTGPRARDLSGKNCDAIYEPPVAFFLEGPRLGKILHRW